jgi:methionyl-tRNA formyltransferase
VSRIRILFMGTPDFAMQALNALCSDEHYEVAGVITQPDRPAGRKLQLTPSPVKKRALELGLPIWTPEKVNTEEFRQEIAALRCEAAVVVAFGQILGQKFLDLFPLGAANIHGSLLPRWRGAAPIQRALIAGDAETGVALQRIVRELDAGPVLGVRRVALDDTRYADDVYPELARLGCELLHVELMDYLRGNLIPQEQDAAWVTHAAKIDKREAAVRWSRSAREILNLIRGLALGPIPHARRSDGKVLKLLRAQVVRETGSVALPGSIVAVSDEGVDVACGQGVLRLTRVQPESRARMEMAEFLKGYPVQRGEVWLDGQAPETSASDSSSGSEA